MQRFCGRDLEKPGEQLPPGCANLTHNADTQGQGAVQGRIALMPLRNDPMFRNRIRAMTSTNPPLPEPQPNPTAFALCPLPLAPWQQALYALALEQAKAVVRPSLPERDLLGVWN